MRRVGLIDITVGNAARLGASQRSTTRRCASHHIATQRASRWGHPGGSRAFSAASRRSCEAKYMRASGGTMPITKCSSLELILTLFAPPPGGEFHLGDCRFVEGSRPLGIFVRKRTVRCTQPLAIVSKICGNQVIRTSASANIELSCGGTYQITVGIERVQKARLIGAGIWLKSPQSIFAYKK
jgi:hypothetical protein